MHGRTSLIPLKIQKDTHKIFIINKSIEILKVQSIQSITNIKISIKLK